MALLKTRDNLELRVKERTVELAKTNKKLREKIAEIKQAQREKLALERKMLHAQKLESQGVLAGGIAHDFNNLLVALLGWAVTIPLGYLKTAPASSQAQAASTVRMPPPIFVFSILSCRVRSSIQREIISGVGCLS